MNWRHKFDDGFTLPGKIEARGDWPEINFNFRPLTPREYNDYSARHQMLWDSGQGGACFDLTVSLLAKKLISWDITDGDGDSVKPLEISEKTLATIPDPVFNGFVSRILAASQENHAKNSR